MFRNGNRRRVGQLAGQLEVEKSVTQSEILGLIIKAKNGNYGMVRKLVSAVKIGIKDKSVSQSTLLENEEFLPVIAKCFTTNDHALQLDALSILVWIAENGTSNEVELMIQSPVIPTLVTSLHSQKKTVRDESLNFLRIISENDASVEVFSRAELLLALKKMARQTTNLDSLANIGKTLYNFFRNAYLGKAGDALTLPPMKEALHELMSVLCSLTHTSDKSIAETVGHYVEVFSSIDGADEVIRSSGILSRIAGRESSQKTEEMPTVAAMCKMSKMQLEGDDSPMDCARLFAAITEVGTGNAKSRNEKKLQQISSSVKHYLGEEKEQKQAFIAKVLGGCDGLDKFVLICVKPNYNHAVHLTGLEIAEAIMCGGSDCLREELLASGGFIPAVTALLARDHHQEVCRKALKTLRLFCEGGRSSSEWTWKVTEQLRNPSILPSLISLAKKTEEKTCILDISKVLARYCFGDQRLSSWPRKLGSSGTADKLGPPVQDVREITSLVKMLINVGDVEITRQVLMLLTMVVTTEGCHRTIFESGILSTVVKYISSDHVLKPQTGCFLIVAAVGGCMATSNVRILEFLKSFKSNKGMRDFYKIVDGIDGRIKRNDEAITTGLIDLFQRVTVALFPNANVVTGPGGLEFKIVDAVMESGFLHTVVKCLEKGRPTPLRCRNLAEYIVVSISNVATVQYAEVLVEAGTIPVLLDLLATAPRGSECIISVLAGLACLATRSAVARDEVINIGGVGQLFALLRECSDGVVMLRYIMGCMYAVMQRSQPATVKHFEKLPECLRHILTDENLQKFRRDNEASTQIFIQRVCDCVREFAEYGPEQVEQLQRKGLFKDIVNALKSEADLTQESAVLAVASICRIKPDSRDEFVKLGILECLPRLFQNPSRYARKASLLLVTNVFHNDVTPAQKKATEEALHGLC